MRSRICSVLVFWCYVIKNVFSQTTAAATEEKPSLNATVQECGESAPSILWPVFITLIVVALCMLLVFIYWKYCGKFKHGKHLVLVTDAEKAEPEFAFDNPGFREGTPVIQVKKLNEVKEKLPQKDPSNIQKISNGHKPPSVDDAMLSNSKVSSDSKTSVIPLKSRDFTGLGFNICGSMRDGIFVKDLLHHGPASETGRIKAGDRISAVRINFSHMVYEDAVAILSYASPYEIEIEVQDTGLLKNKNFINNHSTHPFYRSQSFSTAQQIKKIIPRKLNFNSSTERNIIPIPITSKPAVLQVSNISDKVTKCGGVKVLPTGKVESSTLSNFVVSVTNSEKQHNANIQDLQSDSGIDTKTPTSFDEVDLSPPNVIINQPHEKPSHKENNMKSMLVKSIQNIKDKINNHIMHKSTEKLNLKENADTNNSKEPTSTIMGELTAINNYTEPEISLNKLNENINPRTRSNSCSSNEDDQSIKKSKRKAPPPPVIEKQRDEFNLMDEIESEVNKNFECKDSDSEVEMEEISKKIELNATHVTVHHTPEDSNRKAASLGDLSKISENNSLVPLERAVSLELAEHTPRGSKKRKAPLPPDDNSTIREDLIFGKEARLDSLLSSKLKKSSLFGTLEEVVKQTDDNLIPDSNGNLSTSTPMKTSDDDNNKYLSIDSYSNMSWGELNFNLQDDSKNNLLILDDETIPDLPTSPMPNLPTYVTEIKVLNDDMDATEVNSSDITLYLSAAEMSAENENLKTNNDETKSSDKNFTLTCSNDLTQSQYVNDSTIENSKDNNSLLTNSVKEIINCNGHIIEEASACSPKVVDESEGKLNKKQFKFPKENMSDEQILARMNSSSSINAQKYKVSNNETTTTSRIKTSSSNVLNKLPKLNQSVSPVKAAGSRIPVRANTEPSLKVSLINKDEVMSKSRKYKLLEDGVENSKPINFTASNYLSTPIHKTTFTENRQNGINR